MDKLYTPAPDGYCGDEDNGQTSAWYVFSATGFYPVCPGTDEYVLGTPYFKDMKTMHRNKPNRMSDAEIKVILILFHSGGFRCFKHQEDG